jgi:V-type H+-transporting ATPase subunit a
VVELGEVGLVQFRDTTPQVNSFQRKFINEVRRCEEMERKLRFLEKEISKDGIPFLDLGRNPITPAPREMIDLEASFEKLEMELRDINSNAEALKKNYLELQELAYLLQKTREFLDEGAFSENGIRNRITETGSDYEEHIAIVAEQARAPDQRIHFMAGVMSRKHMATFELVLWRACRGNVFLRRADIDEILEDPVSGEKVHKTVFVVFFQGEQLRQRVKKVSEAFHANLYPCPDSQAERFEMLTGVHARIDDLKTVINTTREHRQRVLVEAAKMLHEWFAKVRKIKAVYHMLNLFNLDVTSRAMIGEFWSAVDDLPEINAALRRGMERSNSSVAPILDRVNLTTSESPPTFHRTNKFTQGFQNIVDAYGVARYREANPTPFAVITFPFLFAVMFGDAGHGVLMFLFALWMVLKERQLMASQSTNEIWNTMFGGRYIILLMGVFSIYTGLIYNDVFAKSFNIFGSSWYPVIEGGTQTLIDLPLVQLNPNVSSPFNSYNGSYPYPLGLDPVWQTAKNKITYTNSIKMKMSIIFGVLQMLFGVTLSLSNHMFFNDTLSIVCEFIPQVLFLLSIFGYLIILIFIKWLKYEAKISNCAPSLLIGLINMFMFRGKDDDPKNPCNSFNIHDNEVVVQHLLVIVAVLCVPWMLLIKPLYLRYRNNQEQQGYSRMADSESAEPIENPPPPSYESHAGHEKFEFGEALVHQSIHTIEYCLGCISNTASYLRLWALSLAHGQLSEVLWNMLFNKALTTPGFTGGVTIFLFFAVWAVLTIGILLIMEGLSAFLHALRLHWVEFMNKFYQGTGYLFVPFNFKSCLIMSHESE